MTIHFQFDDSYFSFLRFQPGTLKYSLHKQAQASLNSGINLREVKSWNFLEINVQNNIPWFYIPFLGGETPSRRRLQRLAGRSRGWLFQPDQPDLRHGVWAMHSGLLSNHVGRTQVRVSMAGLKLTVQETHSVTSHHVHIASHGLVRSRSTS